MKHFFVGIFLFLFVFAGFSTENKGISVELPDIIVTNIDYDIILTTDSTQGILLNNHPVQIKINDEIRQITFINNQARFNYQFKHKEKLSISINKWQYSKDVSSIPLWFSIIPPLLAIFFALIFREVLTSIFIGLFSGTFIIYFYQSGNILDSVFYGFIHIVDKYIVQVLYDTEHLSIIVFSMLIGSTVAVISQNGGMRGIISKLSKYAKSRRSGQLITMIMGVIIFFDDYANTLVVGNTMRPVTDKLKISREKLSYIVDSTAAPIASIAFITTWIGAELSYIQSGLITLNIHETPYYIFLNSLQYAFYPVLTIVFIFFIIWLKRDFGPMYTSEKLVIDGTVRLTSNDNKGEKHIVSSAWNAIIPVMIIVFGTFIGLFFTGYDQQVWHNPNQSWWIKLSQTIGNSDSFKSLMWASLASVTVAVLMTVVQKIQSLQKTMDAVIKGFKSMIMAIGILTLAWSLALLTKQLHTADFFSHIFIAIQIPVFLVPAITFLIAALVSFSTGSSWGTMAILYPLMLPASWLLCQSYGMGYDESMHIFYGVVRAIITGSVFGDHCSPISDTTILSSMASSCNHINHVRTQLPYAITVGFIALVFGIIPTGLGFPTMILYPVSIVIIWFIIKKFGKKLADG